jgi:hypothetical protein
MDVGCVKIEMAVLDVNFLRSTSLKEKVEIKERLNLN